MKKTNSIAWGILVLASIGILILKYLKLISISPSEIWGSISGAGCVLLVVRQNIWNFPIGLANNIFFISLFWSSHLFGDMALQIIYILLGLQGWWQWLYGGKNESKLEVSHTTTSEFLILLIFTLLTTFGLRIYFIKINDASPFLDALTTVLSLVAQYLLNLKRFENWYVWILADIIYVGLYFYKQLYLTSILYSLFIGFCIAGLISWKKLMPKTRPVAETV